MMSDEKQAKMFKISFCGDTKSGERFSQVEL